MQAEAPKIGKIGFPQNSVTQTDAKKCILIERILCILQNQNRNCCFPGSFFKCSTDIPAVQTDVMDIKDQHILQTPPTRFHKQIQAKGRGTNSSS